MELFERDSVCDLICRGYSREYILMRLGVDTGYNHCCYKLKLKDIDRFEYKACYVTKYLSVFEIENFLEDYGDGVIDRGMLLEKFGIYACCRISLNKFFDKIGFRIRYETAYKKRRANGFRDGLVAKYGKPSPFADSDVKAKCVGTRKKKYGGAYTLSEGSSLREPTIASISDTVAFSPAVSRHREYSMIAKYGISSPIHRADIRSKMFGQDDEEALISKFYARLIAKFGSDDVEHAFMNDYVFHVISIDTYFVAFMHWSHGGHWFDNTNSSDIEKSEQWLSNGCYMARCQWTGHDIFTRDSLRDMNCKCVVFWDPTFADVDLYFAMGCPEGYDWDCEYTWLPIEFLTEPEYKKLGDIPYDIGPRQVTAIIQNCLAPMFYSREMNFFNYNGRLDTELSYGTGESRVYAYAYKYYHKLPSELSDSDIYRTMHVSGLVKGYKVFNNTAMKQIIKEYDIKCIFDMYCGSGERAITALSMGVKYEGVTSLPDLRRIFDGICGCNIIDDKTAMAETFSDSDGFLSIDVDAIITHVPYADGLYPYYMSNDSSLSSLMGMFYSKLHFYTSRKYKNVRVLALQVINSMASAIDNACDTYGFRLAAVYDTKGNKLDNDIALDKKYRKKESFRVYERM